MIVVIIAGGSGTRLWPLSTPDYPKHLLKINGDERSLLQNTYDRAKRIGTKVFVLTEASHAHHVKDQLPELDDTAFIIEPARRNTANCIVAGLEYIAGCCDNDEPIAFMAADHYIRDVAGFEHSFEVAGNISKEEGKIVLVGVEPDHPATGFGYIQKGEVVNKDQFVYAVTDFKEKPSHDVAQQYLQSGNYLWNCSYFVATANTFLKNMEQFAPDLLENYNKLQAAENSEAYVETYLGFENISIDYALIEKVKDLLVVPASFDWMDLGSFSDIAKAVATDEVGNSILGKVETEEVNNTFIENHEDKPIAVIGLDNCIVINTPDGILVTRKDMSQKVGDISKRLAAK
ncbi:MAG: mannose-phosphate guanylyltransferase [Candidatus Saccharibacteria bacterium]|nr:mannose-phosphate guanylyltransferase [Candidatus Saccharibacteria bacterium]